MDAAQLAPLVPHVMAGDMVSIFRTLLLSTLPQNKTIEAADQQLLATALTHEGGIGEGLAMLASNQKVPVLVSHVRSLLHGPEDAVDPFDQHAQAFLRLLAACPNCGVEHSVAAYLRARHPDEPASAGPTIPSI